MFHPLTGLGLNRLMPGLRLLQSYRRSWWRGDLLAGVTVAAYLIPQCMAYGELAGVEPVVGLWAILLPLLLYALFGSSPQLSIGPESTTAVMTAAAIAPLTPTTATAYASLTSVLAVTVGLVCLVGFIARLGFLANLLSKPILTGYMAGVAVMMIAGQLGKIGGISLEADTVFGEVWQFLRHLDRMHLPTLFLAIGVFLFLILVQQRFAKAPGPLLAVLLATAMVSGFHLDQQGIAVIGDIPAGLPQLTLPAGFSLRQMAYLTSAAIGIAIVGYSDNVLTARAFANRHGYQIDANQELLALAVCNLGNGLMQGFPVSSSGSRTTIGDTLGSKSQGFSLVALLAVMLVLLFLRPLLASFPKAALGAIVIYAATRLIEIPEFLRLYRFKRSEFALALITLGGVLATDILVGVGVAVGLSVIDLFARLARPHDAVLGEVPNLPGLHDIEDWQGASTIAGLVLYRYDAPLCFANAENFKQRALKAIADETAPVEWFVLNTEAIVEIDITAADRLSDLHHQLTQRHITFALARVKQDLFVPLKRSGLVDRIGIDHIYMTLHSAIAAFRDRPHAIAPPDDLT